MSSYQNVEEGRPLIEKEDAPSSSSSSSPSPSSSSSSKTIVASIAALGFTAALSLFAYTESHQSSLNTVHSVTHLKSTNFFRTNTFKHHSEKVSLAAAPNSLSSLDNTGPSCNTDAVASIHFNDENEEDGMAWWDSDCVEPVENYGQGVLESLHVQSESSIIKGDEEGDGGLIYLDRQRIECPGESFLSAGKFVMDGKTKIYFDAVCTTYAAGRTDCESVHSGYTDPGYALLFLDRHNIECPSGKALTGFRGSSKNGQFELQGECCAGLYEAPTQQPTISPTMSPASEPTEAPIAAPTMRPTKLPYKEPVISAMYAAVQGGLLQEKHDMCKRTSGGELADMEMAIEACGCIAGGKYIDVTEVEDYQEDPDQYAYCQCNNLQLTESDPHGRAVGKDFAISGALYGGHLYFLLKPIYKDYADVACTAPEAEVAKLPPPMYCAVSFSYPKYDSKFVPSGCTLISSADLGWDLLESDSSGVYACASKHTKDVRMDGDMLKSYNLITNEKSLISYVNPAADVSVEFFSGTEFTGDSAIFKKDPMNNIVNFRFKNDKQRSNDNVFSIILSSTAEEIPEDCDALEKIVKSQKPNIPKEIPGVKEEGIDQAAVDVGPDGPDEKKNEDGKSGGEDELQALVDK